MRIFFRKFNQKKKYGIRGESAGAVEGAAEVAQAGGGFAAGGVVVICV